MTNDTKPAKRPLKGKLSDLAATGLSIAALLFLFTGYLKPVQPALPFIATLTLEQPDAPLFSGSGFAENAVYFSTKTPMDTPVVRRFGSWLGSDSSVGEFQSAWFRPAPEFRMLVAGYPSGHGCELYVEAQKADGSTKRIVVSPDSNPGEVWQTRTVSIANDKEVTRVRVVAVDASSSYDGWMGFSLPYKVVGSHLGQLREQLALVALTAAGTFVAMLFPGLLWRRLTFRRGDSQLAFLWIPVPGFLGLAAIGLLCWITPASVTARELVQWTLAPIYAYALYHSVRFPLSTYTTSVERRALLAIIVLAALSISKSVYSLGPEGELYANQISRTLEVSDRSDSRIPYHIIQLIASRSGPYSDFATRLLSPFNFSSRAPMVALAASPMVFAAPVSVSKRMPPDQPWTVFDPQGFSAYRTVMIVIACCSLIAAFGVASLFLSEEWTLLAFLLTVTTPFIIHETYFTWPKLEAAWFVLLSAYLIFRARYFMAGLLLGIGYMCHPLALLWTPALLGVLVLSSRPGTAHIPAVRKISIWSLRAALLLGGAVLFVLVWAVINRGHNAQNVFWDFLFMAGGQSRTLAHWLQTRWTSVCNTLVPLNLFLLHRTDRSINSVYGESPAIVEFYAQYWTTLPFGVGITYFGFLLRLLYAGLLHARAWLMLVFVVPFLCFSVYWGANSTGMLREGLHPLVIGMMIFSVVMWKKIATRDLFSAACCIALLLRGIETVLMLILPSILNRHRLIETQFNLSDIVALLTMLVSAGWLYVFTFRHAWSLSGPLAPSLSKHPTPPLKQHHARSY